jgi:hypothetical protein
MTDRPDKTTDGTGAPILDDAMYYVQDARSIVGNCGTWWAPNGAGYVCNLDDAGLYTATRVRGMRETDVPWPHAYVRERAERHVRTDNSLFRTESAAAIVDTGIYYILRRGYPCGNCGDWWAAKSKGHTLNLDEAGVFSGAMARDVRSNDVPWERSYVEAHVVWHVRVDHQAFSRRDDQRPQRDAQTVEASRAHEQRLFLESERVHLTSLAETTVGLLERASFQDRLDQVVSELAALDAQEQEGSDRA